MLETLRERRSIRKYKDIKVEKEKIERILKAGILAPSSMNKKPVEFIVAEDKKTLSKLETCKAKGTLGLKTAPLAIVVIADAEKSNVWIEDASIASTLIQLEVQELGLGSCWIQIRNRQSSEGDSEEAVRKLLNIPERYGVLSILTIGYKDEDKNSYDDSKLDLEKVHYGEF
ncbi:MAG: nitroreductase family protein [Clostridium baratii]|uniref:nitroreductase family protein n=1 Tax=Clostridium baratii TaxID=1561 RepID=UPI00242CEF56|nr:nitroreductase family protein [Clostridium baratii]MBS6005630.1 nitroreductase family protein [Clostridium baratii]